MRRILTLAIAACMTASGAVLIGCQGDTTNNDKMRDEQIANPVGANDGGLSRTGAGGSEGSSASGMDRPGGGESGSHGANSGSSGAGPTSPQQKSGEVSGTGAAR
jgi:hypothetical protein